MPEIISEFTQQVAPKATSDPNQSMENKAAAKLVNGLLKISQTASEDFRREWPDNYRFVVAGQQWPIERPRWRFSEVVNITWGNIMTEVGIQTDQRPQVDFIPTEPSDFAFAEVMKEVNNVNWSKSGVTGHGWQQKVAHAVFKSKIYHVVHAMVGWDEEMENGLGDVDFKILDPYGCFWDPLAKDIGEARWFIYAEPRPTGELRKKYPKWSEFIKPDVTMFDEPSKDGVSDTDIDRFFRTSQMTARFETIRNDREHKQFGGEPMTLWVRCWMKDDTVEELRQSKTLESGIEEIEFVQKLKFPRGRYIETCNNIALVDRENEYEDGKFPITRLVNYDYGEYAGDNEVTHQRGPQNIINYVWSHILDQLKMASNPQTVVTHNASEIVKRLTNEPGLVVEVPSLNDIRREPGVGIANGMFNVMDLALSLIDKVGGLQDVTRGSPQPGVTSGLMLEGFVEAAQTRPRLKNRSVDEWLTQVGYLMASRYLQFYTVPRVFRITNKEGFPEFVEFFVKEDERGNKVASIKRQPLGEGNLLREPQEMEVNIKGMPDIKIKSGSNLPFAKAQKTATALDLYSRQAITLESLLKAISWPAPEEEAKKVKEEQQAAMQQAAPPEG